jgi:hypothetical protein
MIHFLAEITNPAELLDPQAYDAGALLRWESSATVDGVYVEGGTVALVADQFLYDVWDPAGSASTWYRTRVSDVGGSLFSEYTTPWQPALGRSPLTLAQLKGFGITGLPDEQLLILLDATAETITRYIGPMGPVTEWLSSSGELLLLGGRAAGVSSVVENGTTLDATDYAISPTGETLRRLDSGSHPGRRWLGRVLVTYTPWDDLAQRQRVQLELVRLAIAFAPGLASQTIGTWSEAYQSNPKPYAEQQADILATLADAVGIL